MRILPRLGERPLPFDLAGKRIWVAGHDGMVGRALLRALEKEQCTVLSVGRKELDLRVQADVERWMMAQKPDVVFVAAATVGGIGANMARPAEFIYDNLAIAAHVIHGAHKAGVRKLLYLGSSCIYPRMAEQPMVEEALLSGKLEPTNQWYAVAKIAGLKMAQAYREQYGCDFISAMPTNLYGPYDRFDAESSHVIPALMLKLHAAKMAGAAQAEVWGSGKALREFLHVDDLAAALMVLMKQYSGSEPVNVGTGIDVSIRELAGMLAKVVGYAGKLHFDANRPDGSPRKLLDSSRMARLGWKPRIGLREGLEATYQWYREQ